jgi:hypothetical protein
VPGKVNAPPSLLDSSFVISAISLLKKRGP